MFKIFLQFRFFFLPDCRKDTASVLNKDNEHSINRNDYSYQKENSDGYVSGNVNKIFLAVYIKINRKWKLGWC